MPAQDPGAADHGGRDIRRPGFLRAVGPDDEPVAEPVGDAPAGDSASAAESGSTRQDGGLGIVQALELPAPPPPPTPAPFVPRGAPAALPTQPEQPEQPERSQPAPKHAAPRTDPDPATSTQGLDAVSASREIFSALGLDPAQDETSRGKHAAPPAAEATQATQSTGATGRPVAGRTKQPVEVLGGAEVGAATDVSFAPRTGTRTVVGLLALVTLAATGYAAYRAYEDPRFFTIGIAGTLLVVTLVLYAVRASSTPTRLAIRGGQLIVTRGSARETFDLTSRYTRVEIVGKPGRRGWKVLFGRFGRDPFVVDGSLVDPRAFDAALRAARGEKWHSRPR